MKVAFIRSEEQLNPEFVKAEHDACVRAHKAYVKNGQVIPPLVRRPPGYVHEAHDAWELCVHGMALPVDEEAKAKCGALGLSESEIMFRHRRLVKFENTVYDAETGKPIEIDATEDDEE